MTAHSKPRLARSRSERGRYLVLAALLASTSALAQVAPERPHPDATTAPAQDPERKADKRSAAQKAEDKRAADRRVADVQAQAQAERLARDRLEQEKRRLESAKLDLERRLRTAELARQASAAQPLLPPVVPAAVLHTVVAHHPHRGEPLVARQTFVDSWGQSGPRESAPRMVVIPPAPPPGFLMGSPFGESGRDSNEKQHRVRIPYVFALSENEVTVAQWDACVADGGCSGARAGTLAGREQHPVVHVSWHAARAYADWLNSRFRLARDNPYRYRLPSEAEWEYAARAGNAGPFGLADNRPISPDLANYDSRASYLGSPTRDPIQDSTPVGSYPANAFGVKDMLGNAWEWLSDCYEPDYDKTPRDGSAHRENDPACAARVVRGGAWSFTPDELRAANRFWAPPAFHDNKGGFRVARTMLSGV